MRAILIAAAAAFAFASAASAATPAPGTYSLNAAGKCIGPAPKTSFAAASKCAAPAAPKHCRDPKTKKFTSCKAPGAVPA